LRKSLGWVNLSINRNFVVCRLHLEILLKSDVRKNIENYLKSITYNGVQSFSFRDGSKAEALNSNVYLINHAIISPGGLTKLFFLCSITRYMEFALIKNFWTFKSFWFP